MKPTRESLERDRKQREKKRRALADQYDSAADSLARLSWPRYRDVIVHLRQEAERERQKKEWSPR
jgi:hypothetical protein